MPTIHTLEPTAETLRGNFSREYEPLLTVHSGDSIRYRTIDAGWHVYDNPQPFYNDPPNFEPRDREADPGHALIGPVYIDGAVAGDVLAIDFDTIVVGNWGWSAAGWNDDWNRLYHLPEEEADQFWCWKLDAAAGIATSEGGHTLPIAPFMGNVGMPEDIPGAQSTTPPRWCGGNIDCKELVAGTTLYLPVPVDGGLLMLGDGHARQGDGEVSGVAIECPMAQVDITVRVIKEQSFMAPRARTDEGWLAFGFGETLTQAQQHALDHLLDMMTDLYAADGMTRADAWNLASLVADLRITQVVNGTVGVHAVLPHHLLAT